MRNKLASSRKSVNIRGIEGVRRHEKSRVLFAPSFSLLDLAEVIHKVKLQSATASDTSCDGYHGPSSQSTRLSALISVSSAFLAVTTMSRKSSLYNQINLSHGRGRRKPRVILRSIDRSAFSGG